MKTEFVFKTLDIQNRYILRFFLSLILLALTGFMTGFSLQLLMYNLVLIQNGMLLRPVLVVFPSLCALLAVSLSPLFGSKMRIFSALTSEMLLITFGIHQLLFPSAALQQVRYASALMVQKEKAKDTPAYESMQLFQTDPVPVYIETGYSLPPDSADGLRKIWNRLPKILQEKASGIYFASEPTFLNDMNQPSQSLGYSVVYNGSIVLRLFQNARVTYPDGSTADSDAFLFYESTLIHELMHQFDVREEGATLFWHETPEFQELYAAHLQDFGDYAASDPKEMFAETGMLYFLYPDLLEQRAPVLADWFRTLFTLS